MLNFSNFHNILSDPFMQLFQRKGVNQDITIENQQLFSMNQLLDMEANELSQHVFKLVMRSDSMHLLSDGNHSSQSEMYLQNKLKDCEVFKGINVENIPEFKYLQVKKKNINGQTTLQFLDITSDIFYT